MKKVIGIHETGRRTRKSDNTIYDRIDLFIETDEIPEEYTGNFKGSYVYSHYIERDQVKLTGVKTWGELVGKEIEFKCGYNFNNANNGLRIQEIYVVT